MKCKKCGKSHPTSYHLVDKISAKGYPVDSGRYKTAHEEATKKERNLFPKKNYEELKHMDKTIAKGELIGKNDKAGRVSVSKRVPKKLRAEVAFHERVESQRMRKKKG